MTRPSRARAPRCTAALPPPSTPAPLWIALAGLPGAGKSTLARELARCLGAHVLDRDRLREATFGPGQVHYTAIQDDLCGAWLIQAATWLAGIDPGTPLILDGQTFTRRPAARRLEVAARRAGARLVWVVARVDPRLAARRLARSRHPAANRRPRLVRELARKLSLQGGFDLRGPRLDLDFRARPKALAERVQLWLAGLAAPERPRKR